MTAAPLSLASIPPGVWSGSCGRLQVARFDLVDPELSGNKWYKLRLNLEAARAREAGCIASFGGAWSNHLHALAAAGHRFGMRTVGFVRAEAHEPFTPTLRDARRWGMELRHLSRADYRRRAEPGFLDELLPASARPHWVPEGGANALGVRGCEAMGQALAEAVGPDEQVCVVAAVGTGATLAGLVRSVPAHWRVEGISVLKGMDAQAAEVSRWLGDGDWPVWRLRHEFHRGGYARADTTLLDFCRDFERDAGVPLEPVYTGKMMMAIREMMAAGEFSPATRVVAVHSGGLQGARGFPGFGIEEGRV